MSFSPLLLASGYPGWLFLRRTQPAQEKAFHADRQQMQDEAYFRANIAKAKTADNLVSDRRLLKVALGAFGLDSDFDARFFIRKVLEDGTLKADALANRLANKQYLKFSAAFGFGDFSTPRTQLSDFPDKILVAYRAHQFESAVGTQNDDFRLALNAERELTEIATQSSAKDDTRWLRVMGNAPLRKVFEVAFGLPARFGALDLDQQLEVFRDKAEANLGSGAVTQFSDPVQREKLIRLFLIRSEAATLSTQIGSGATAMLMMQQTITAMRASRT